MANEQETSDEEMDALDAALSEAAREKIRKAEEEAGMAGDGPGSVADFAEMDADVLVALSREALGEPVTPPTGFANRKAWDLFLAERGVSRG